MATYRNELPPPEPLVSPPARGIIRVGMDPSRSLSRGGRLLLLFVSLIGGCTPASHERLTGRWVGHPDDRANGLNASPTEGDAPLSDVELQVEFLKSRQFVMAMRGVGADASARRGRYRVLRAHGTRWEIELAAEDPAQTIRLELAFRDADHMTVREVEGDSRLSVFQLQRMPPADSGEPIPASTTDEPDA